MPLYRWLYHWASLSEPYTSAFNVELCLYGMSSVNGTTSSAGHLYRTPLLPPHAPIALPHSISFIEQVCPTVRPCRHGGENGWLLRLETKSCRIVPPTHCYLTHTCPTVCCIHLVVDTFFVLHFFLSCLHSHTYVQTLFLWLIPVTQNKNCKSHPQNICVHTYLTSPCSNYCIARRVQSPWVCLGTQIRRFTDLYYFSCSAGIDYVGLGTTDSLLTFQTGGNNTLCVMIMIIDDNNIEPAESFSVRFRFTQTGSNIPVFAPTTTVVILDQDQGTYFSLHVPLYNQLYSNSSVVVHVIVYLFLLAPDKITLHFYMQRYFIHMEVMKEMNSLNEGMITILLKSVSHNLSLSAPQERMYFTYVACDICKLYNWLLMMLLTSHPENKIITVKGGESLVYFTHDVLVMDAKNFRLEMSLKCRPQSVRYFVIHEWNHESGLFSQTDRPLHWDWLLSLIWLTTVLTWLAR